MTKYITAKALQLTQSLRSNSYNVIFDHEINNYDIKILLVNNELCLITTLNNNHLILYRLISNYYIAETDIPHIKLKLTSKNLLKLEIPLQLGSIYINLEFKIDPDKSLLIANKSKLLVKKEHAYNTPERDILVLSEDYSFPEEAHYKIEQIEGRTGQCFFCFNESFGGSLGYLQDLGALDALAQLGEVSLMDTVKIDWPSLGFKIPQISNSLQKDERYSIQQFFVKYDPTKITSNYQASSFHLKFISNVFADLIKPAKKTANILSYAYNSIRDLKEHKGCWKQVESHAYLNAYTNSYDSPAESMVQTAIFSPLYLFNKKHPTNEGETILELLTENLPNFFDSELNLLHRWLPTESHLLDYDEEHMHSFIMDSWYLHYPILQLAYLFENGFKDQELEKKYQKSLIYLRKVANTFDYKWPIFFNINKLEILKTNGNENVYGEIDTGGLYILIMLKSYKLLDKKIYLNEAKKAVKKIINPDLDSLYQSNNTAYTAEALLEYYLIDPDTVYIQAAEIYLGNIIRNCAIWNMKYGNAAERETFMALFPLKEAPYSAPFEEHETLAIFHRIIHLVYNHNIEINSDLLYLMIEYIQYAVHRFPYYVPARLAKDMLADKSKSGFVDSNIWIPIEDLGDGWESIGKVGQEVYGAGLFLNLCLHHVLPLNDKNYMISTLPFITQQSPDLKIIILGEENKDGIIYIIASNNDMSITINDIIQEKQKTYNIKSKDIITFNLN